MGSRIDVNLNFFPLAWFLYFVEPIVEINGEISKKAWGTHSFELNPGKHVVRIYFSYMGKKECGLNKIELHLAPGETKKIAYYMPPFLASKGGLKLCTKNLEIRH